MIEHIAMIERPLRGSEATVRAFVGKTAASLIVHATPAGKLPFFRRLLLAPGALPSGRCIAGLRGSVLPADPEEWRLWTRALTNRDSGVPALMRIGARFGVAGMKVWVMPPYPPASLGAGRWARLRAWLEDIVEGPNSGLMRHGWLEGFAWCRESIPSGDRELVQLFNGWVRRRSLASLWLANHGGTGLAERQPLGFSRLALHSNYAGAGYYDLNWQHGALDFALAERIGWQADYARMMRNGSAADSLKALNAYLARGGAGPVVHRFPADWRSSAMPALADGVFRAVRGGGVS